MKLKQITHPLPKDAFAHYRQIVTHSHFDRHGKGSDVCSERLHEWCSAYKTDAIGIGSPWVPETNSDYKRCETIDRDSYYANPPSSSLLRVKEINSLIDTLNEKSDGTFFYLDNETPKGRNGHLWYFNFCYLVPAWHDYSQDRPVQYYWNDPHIEYNLVTEEPHRRRPYYDVVEEQRLAGAVAVWAHPTSWWRDSEGAFITNIAAEMPAHLILDGKIDGLVVSGYDAFNRNYRALYFMLLDQGYRIPAFAEMDLTSTCLKMESAPLASYIAFPEKPHSAKEIADAAKTANCFIGNGISIAIELDGCRMGGSLPSKKGKMRNLKISLSPRPGETYCSRVEINGYGGKCLASLEHCAEGEYEFEFEDNGAFQYFTACAFGEHEDPQKRQQEITYFSMTNPIWLLPESYHQPEPANMRCSIAFRPGSPFLGWKGTLPGYPEFTADAVKRVFEIPAKSVLELTSPDGKVFRSYPFFEDAQVQNLISNLSEGGFLKFNPELEAGEVPAEYFNPEHWRACLKNITALY